MPPDIRSLLADHELFHSDFQMDYLITVRAGGTPYGCYKQALRELYKRWRGLRQAYSDRALLEVDIDEIESQLGNHWASEFGRRRAEINLATKRLGIEEADRVIQDTEREFRRFAAQAATLKESIGDLTPERRAELDREMWRHRLRCMATVDIITRGALGENTVTFLQAAPREWRAPILDEIKAEIRNAGCDGHNGLIAWFESYEPSVAALETIPEIDLRRLLKESGTS
jgi:hypothetical protein